MSCAALVLAAGESRRLGQPKQLVELAGENLLERAVRAARQAGCAPVLVVLGANAQQIEAESRLEEVKVIVNQEWREGMASSIRAGVQAVEKSLAGIVLMTCDQPAADAKHLEKLMQQGLATKGRVSSSYAGRRGVPAYFPLSDAPKLMALTGDVGARTLLEGSRSVELAGGEVDVDTPEGLKAARQQYA